MEMAVKIMPVMDGVQSLVGMAKHGAVKTTHFQILLQTEKTLEARVVPAAEDRTGNIFPDTNAEMQS